MMAQLIDKDALAAEIEKRLNYRIESLKTINNGTFWKEGQSEDEFNESLTRCAFNAAKNELFELKCFLDTLEVKKLQEEPVSDDLEEAAKNHAVERYRITRNRELAEKCKWSYITGAKWLFERVKEALLSEVLPCFMHGGEADEVVAKLDEVLNQK